MTNYKFELQSNPSIRDKFPAPFLLLRAFRLSMSLNIFVLSVLLTLTIQLLVGFNPGNIIINWTENAISNTPATILSCIQYENPENGQTEIRSFNFFETINIYRNSTTDANNGAGGPAFCFSDFGFHALALALVSFFGLAISRIAAVKLTIGAHVSIGSALHFAVKKFFPLWSAVAIGLFSAVFCFLATYIGSLIPCLGLYLYPLWLLLIAVGVIVTGGVIAGIPFYIPALVVENGDCFDAVSRGFAYGSQKILSYLSYLFFMVFWAVIGLAGVTIFLTIVTWVTQNLVFGCDFSKSSDYASFWMDQLDQIPGVLLNAYIFTASTAIYTLLRFKIDAVELDEVYSEVSCGIPAHELPNLD